MKCEEGGELIGTEKKREGEKGLSEKKENQRNVPYAIR
jgi:hypothetical protein